MGLRVAREVRDGRLRAALGDVGAFGQFGQLTLLREYQLEPARAVVRSALAGAGLTFTVMFPRQSGKNELSAQAEAFLMLRHQKCGGSLVKAAPTFRPQLQTSLARLERILDGRYTRGQWRRRRGYAVELGAATCTFLSAQPGANIVGATANVLLEGDEAQDLYPDKWDRDLVPMGATGNATRVLYGTPWTADTLLAREVERARELERRDGIKRHFEVSWEEVAEAVPAYRRHVAGEIARLGADHPIVRTQYLLRPLARADRLLSAEQLEKLWGDHPAIERPSERPAAWGRGGFVAGLDVAGADEEDPDSLLLARSPRRDSTVLTIAFAEETLVEAPAHPEPVEGPAHPEPVEGPPPPELPPPAPCRLPPSLLPPSSSVIEPR